MAVFETLTGAGEVDAREARNGLRHAAALTMTKLADGLIDPKLVLSWLGGALGVPAGIVGLFVPIREAGALVPQILLAGRVQAMPRRKWAWVGGSVGQGLGAGLIVLAALTLEGWTLGVVMALALAGLAVSRALCSVSYKDILGKTVEKTRRGAVTGIAGSASALLVLGFAAALILGGGQALWPVLAAISAASALWLLAAALFSRLEEQKSRPQTGPAIDLTPLWQDSQFRRFIAARGALTVTALAPPYFVLLGGGQSALQALGALMVASAAASFVSSYVWGRLADRSSRLVLALAGLAGAGFMTLAVQADLAGWTAAPWVIPAILFGLMVAYHGVRQGRSVYLVDMAPEDARSSYAALANTAIGVLLLVVGALGAALATLGPLVALAGFAGLSLLGGWLALGLDEVEQ
ncbi:Major Facilitator Superfamily protein [Maliponia aquimaris]|uniref:Major Facilitator Superfamily protein n=2 Tax=Maliponia aquimaris TaxID=1673631 RepID=A0A238KFD2_9RHOB|nr:Major Facilitator Superfamily protein [Maliponia aquimaris]